MGGIMACDGIVFDTRSDCPFCGGRLSGYDTKKKQFAILKENDILVPVYVFVKRFTCRECHALCFADEPFYPATRIGSPLVDLCRALGATMPYNRVAAHLLHFGIVIDRGTVRNYALRTFPPVSTTDLFGIHLPLSILSLADLTTRFGEEGGIPGTETLAACGFPSAYRTTPDLRLSPEQGNERDKKDNKEKRQPERP